MTYAYNNGLFRFMDLTMYYCGNAHLSDGKLNCQHGDDECYLNRVCGCGISFSNDVDQWYPFIRCIESINSIAVKSPSTIEKCAKKAGLNGKEILDCTNGPMGEKLHMEAYEQTQKLFPKKTWVPWVVVEGIPMYDFHNALTRAVCIHLDPNDRVDICFEEDLYNAMNFQFNRTYPDPIVET